LFQAGGCGTRGRRCGFEGRFADQSRPAGFWAGYTGWRLGLVLAMCGFSRFWPRVGCGLGGGKAKRVAQVEKGRWALSSTPCEVPAQIDLGGSVVKLKQDHVEWNLFLFINYNF